MPWKVVLLIDQSDTICISLVQIVLQNEVSILTLASLFHWWLTKQQRTAFKTTNNKFSFLNSALFIMPNISEALFTDMMKCNKNNDTVRKKVFHGFLSLQKQNLVERESTFYAIPTCRNL